MSEVKKTSELSGAKEKGIEERTYDLSVLTKEERINLLSLVYDDVRDVQDDLFLRVMDSSFDSRFTFDEFVHFTQLLKAHIDYCEHRLAENPFFPSYFVEYCSLSTSALDKLSSLISPQSEQEQSDVTDTEPQEQEREEPQEKNSAVFKVTLYFENGQTLSKIFKYHTSDFDIGFIFKLFQNSPEPPDSNFCIFNIFNFVDVRGKVVSIEVSCDISAMKKSTTSLQSRVRYDIIEVHSVEIDNFKFDNRDVVAFCQTIEEAERLVKALSALNDDKPHYRYEYELIAPYNSIFDEHFDIQNIPGVLDDTLPF